MGLCVAPLWFLLLICLSQAELRRVWAAEQEDASRGTDGDRSSFYRTAGNQQPLAQYRAVRNAPGDRGRELDMGSVTNNMTHVVEDSQRYYRWQSFGPTDDRTEELWVDLSSRHKSQVQIHSILSSTHRKAARVALSFDFPFYGHYLRQIIIATGGFIFMGEITHRMLTATQYVAPLMANFDPSFSNNSTVKYLDNGNLFVVQWDNVHLKDREDEGSFTFQAALHRNGTIVFNYKDVPVPLERINSTEHPVKVGLSDAFMAPLSPQPSDDINDNADFVDREQQELLQQAYVLVDVKQQTIYEYHRVEINTTRIMSGSAFEFTPLPTCLQHTSCELCMTSNLTTGCGWCNTLQRCSDGIDRHRHEWLDYNCPEEAKATCEDYNTELPDTSTSSYYNTHLTPTPPSSTLDNLSITIDFQTAAPDHNGVTENTAIIAGVVAALVLLVALTLLAVYYINTHPTVAPPFDLMQRRTNNYWPSMKFRNQGCQSGYAEVELGVHEKEGFIEAEQCY